MTAVGESRPTTLLAELTYRCPLHCPYCSNPLDLALASAELDTGEWTRVLTEARALGVLQLGLSGGEPLVRRDLEAIVRHARALGLYVTLVTSGLGLTTERLALLREAGLEHVQISFQDASPDSAEHIAGARSWDAKVAAAAIVRASGMAFSINAVLHRANIHAVEAIAALAAELGADRLELANTQYYGWALANRDALMPTRDQVAAAADAADRVTERYRGRMQVLYVLPDYFQTRPKACMGGWGAVYMVVAPDGRVLPCQAAGSIDGLEFPSAREHSLDWAWRHSDAFTRFRGESWMREPCRSCAYRAETHGGCRCQAFLLTGDAANADPVCELSEHRGLVTAAADGRSDGTGPPSYLYRAMSPRTRAGGLRASGSTSRAANAP